MSYEQRYTLLDGAWHLIVEGEHTKCGLVIPPNNGFVTEVPEGDKVHCNEDSVITISTPKGGKVA